MEHQFKCSGNCLNCQPAQRAYCASQHAYSNMKVLDMIAKAILDMQGEVSVIKEKIEAMQNNEASVFDPNEDTKPLGQPLFDGAATIGEKAQ